MVKVYESFKMNKNHLFGKKKSTDGHRPPPKEPKRSFARVSLKTFTAEHILHNIVGIRWTDVYPKHIFALLRSLFGI